MADEIKPGDEEILALENEGGPPVGEEQISISKADLDALRASADAAASLTGTVSALESQLQQMRQPAPRQDGAPAPITGEDLFRDPEIIRRTAREEMQSIAGPIAAQFAGNMAGMAIDNFKTTKVGDPLYSGAAPLFDKKIKTLNLSALGALSPEGLRATLNECWKASVGEYVLDRRGMVKPKPANLGGGDAGGSETKPKTLQDIDKVAYNMAVQAGWTQEQMDEFAKTFTVEDDK